MQQKLTYLVVDDNELDRLLVEAEAAAFPFLSKIASCHHALEALEIIANTQPDIVFADIEMPGASGLQLIKSVAGKIAAPVFITSHTEFAVEGFELEAFDYIIKPFTSERFARCAHRLQEFFQLRQQAEAFEKQSNDNFIIVKHGYDKHRIALHDIIYLEAMKDYTKITTTTGSHLVLGTLSGMLAKLPGINFKQVHRSFVVNTHKITAVKGAIIFLNDHEVPVGKLYKQALVEII